MIGKLKGRVDEVADTYVIVDVNGVGYVVYMTMRALGALPLAGETVSCFIETQVREDAIRLYGFASRDEQAWFRLLQNVQGVGAKVALALLGTLSPAELANAIALKDIALISRAPGVGKKVAERIAIELKNKAPAVPGALTVGGGAQPVGEEVADAPVLDAISALVNLGYGREQAAAAGQAAYGLAGAGADSAGLIRLGLKELAR
ncbi:MAG: Holliday junction DNA helicase RuvA [Candidatus Tokpelaia hoelldobleri]|uniref:Holliday junction branch migration complex subunit RuvA n=1 Tax=Candidatus Tokpelaia hoelldobleri TaxID=1902579 RepID=A0A1U9JSS3_9HYPH|nr:MAG: Holliday junction DNA helicase RuvA [Candidatus Tokpelaia hoelldoblerii]